MFWRAFCDYRQSVCSTVLKYWGLQIYSCPFAWTSTQNTRNFLAWLSVQNSHVVPWPLGFVWYLRRNPSIRCYFLNFLMNIAFLGVHPPSFASFFWHGAGLPCLQIVHETLRGKCSTRRWHLFLSAWWGFSHQRLGVLMVVRCWNFWRV